MGGADRSPSAGDCELWRIPLAQGAQVPDPLWSVLSMEERGRASRLRHLADRVAYVAAHALLRLRLGEMTGTDPRALRFGTGPFGKPVLADPGPGLAFNLSHCRSMVCVAFSVLGAVGVDVEPSDRGTDAAIPALMHDIFTPRELRQFEADAVSSPRTFVRLWTLKEAVIKATGVGLSHGLKSFSVVLDDAEPQLVVEAAGTALSGHDVLHLRQWSLDDHVLALARIGPAPPTVRHRTLDLAGLAAVAAMPAMPKALPAHALPE